MFLRNWYNLLKSACYGCSGNDSIGITATNIIGESFLIYNYYNAIYPNMASTSVFSQNKYDNGIIRPYIGEHKVTSIPEVLNGSTVCFGSGVTPPNLDDYCLEEQYVDSIKCITSNVNRAIIGNTVTLELNYTLRNIGDTEALIAEVGIVAPINYAGSSHQCVYPCLIDRTVLSEPVVIAPGNSEVVTYTITYNLPSPE